MRTELFWLLSFCGFAALSLVCGLVAWPQLAAAWPVIEEQIDRFRRLHPLAKVALLVFVAGFIAYGSTKTNQVGQVSGTNGVEIVEGGETNAPPMMLMMAMPSFGDESPTVTPEDVARLWQLSEVRTNLNICYTMPEGAMMASNWWVRGAYEDVVRVPGSGFQVPSFRFPYGSNEHCSAWAFAWGKVRFALADTNTEIVAVGAPMSAVPYRSRLWSAAGTNGSWLVTWEDFALNRDTGTPVNAQIELRANGDFITRSNEVESVHQRLNPEDWDGDGWENGDDPNPRVWDEFYDDFWQELPEGANESAYCWIEIRPRWHSYIEFAGDGPSDLDDPYLWAKAGETYRVQLLIGKTYTIVGSQPVDVVGRSSPSIEIVGNGTSAVEVVWPLTFSALAGNGSSFMMRVVPSGLGGTFTWTRHCCGLTGYGNQFWWAHEHNCYCTGCYASGWYSYEGYEKECTGGHCCCPGNDGDDDDPYESVEDDGPYSAGATVSFSEPVVIFEDAYTNMPGEVVARQSTRTTLTCIAHGGETGGTATFSIENGAKLVSFSGGSLPVTRFVPPLQKVEFEIVYEGQLPSGREEDIVAKADFTERVTGTRHSTQRDWLTAVKVEISPEDPAPENLSPNRHLFGVHEKVNYRIHPADANVELTDGHGGRLISVDDFSRCFYCPWTGGVFSVTATCGSGSHAVPFSVIEPQVECRDALWNDLLDTNAVEGVSGWVGMRLVLFLLPKTVSFQRLQMVEIPVPSSDAHELLPGDYFSIMPDVLPRTHDASAGADIWKIPQFITGDGYYWTGDKAQMPHECPPVTNRVERIWAQGTMNWDIPVGWGLSRILKGQMRPNPTSQVYEMSEDGTLTIRKYNHWIRRDVSGRVWLDGRRVNAWWSDLW